MIQRFLKNILILIMLFLFSVIYIKLIADAFAKFVMWLGPNPFGG